jgi:tagatose 1,6-diphosphate aldolase
MRLRWFDPGPLVDRELELIPPSDAWVEAVLAACHHPETVQNDARLAETNRKQLQDLLRAAPGGRDPGDPKLQRVQAYMFWMRLRPTQAPNGGWAAPPLVIAGGCSLRVADTPDVRRCFGHVGYHVYPPARGRRLAERAVRLLLPLARAHGLKEIWVTCNPDNWASRRTCERLGAVLVDLVDLPPDNVLYRRGERQKCRYLLKL